MTTVIQHTKPAKALLSNSQKTFNRLKKKVETLQYELQTLHQTLDRCLQFYYDQIQPEKKVLLSNLTEFVKTMYRHYQGLQKLSKKERDLLKELISDKIDQIFGSTTFNEADPEICEIFKNLNGVSYDEIAASQLTSMKKEMQEMFKDSGIDIDLSTLELTDDEHEIRRKLSEAMATAESSMEDESPAKPKTKKQLQKEMKEQELEALQKKGLSSIYKQLAKAFHPDLEQVPEQRVEKENLMKKLTCAYENNDLHTLLSLEMEWMSRSNNSEKIQGDDQLKIYNSILKDQIETLQMNMDMILLHPKYFHIQEYLDEAVLDGIFILKMVHSELKTETHHFQVIIKKLQSTEAEKTVQAILREYSQC